MLTTSEIAVTATIWTLTAIGGFFGTRGALRKKRLKSGTAQGSDVAPQRAADTRNSGSGTD